MIQLHQVLKEVAEKWKYKLDEFPNGIYRMDVLIPLISGGTRFQYVYIWIVKNRFYGKDAIYMNSRCGVYSPTLDLYKVLKAAGGCNYSSITITTDKTADGTPCETIIAQAALPLETCNADILNEAIYDTAVSADYVEGLLFGSDTN